MKKTLIILLTLISLQSIAQAQVSKKRDINAELQQCLDSAENYTTAGMSNCIIKATAKWDNVLNENYKKLMSLLSPETQKKLRESQRKWIEFRDKEIQLSRALYNELGGTMWIPIIYETNMKLTRDRALELEEYINNIDN
jgi:uncharacterized protein YecT (DUF1311 family)